MTLTKERHPIRLATIQTYLFGRALRVLARDAAAELRAKGIEPDPRIPVLDQLAESEPTDPIGGR
jgi:hypothetical protein